MAVPKKRTTSSKRNMRRSHHATVAIRLQKCPKCKTAVPRHTACSNFGTYNGGEVINVMKKLDKKERKAKEQELAQY